MIKPLCYIAAIAVGIYIYNPNNIFTSKVELEKQAKIAAVAKEQKAAYDRCMDQHRWNTTSLNTARFAVQLHYHKQGKGELAKYVSDRQAVEIVYCSDFVSRS